MTKARMIRCVVCAAALLTLAVAPVATTAPSSAFRIDHVVDGDTVDLTNGAKIRLVQIDTPEVYFGTECYGPQASAIVKRLLPPGTAVRLAAEPATDRVDQYGRLLRYLIRARDGLNVNVYLVRVGAAAPYFYAGRRRNQRPNPIALRVRSLVLLVVIGAGVLITTVLAGLTTGAGAFGANVGTAVRVAAILLATLVNVGLFVLAFRVLTAREVASRKLRAPALLAGIGWELVQLLGTYFVAHALKGAPEAYGVFGLVLGLIAWIYLLAVVTVLAAEIAVVAQRELWPRALLTLFTDDVELTAADKRAYVAYAQSERYKGFELIDVSFHTSEAPSPGPERFTKR